MILEQTVLRPCPHVLCAGVGDEAVLYHEQSGAYFGLNAVAARVWELAETGVTIRQILDVLASEFEVEPGVLDADIRSLVPQLVSQGLCEVQSVGAGGAGD